MHSLNLHNADYNFAELCKAHSLLSSFVFQNSHGNSTLDFSNPEAVFHLNKALLLKHYGLTDWKLPEGHLCPPVPGRVDYIHHISDLILDSPITNRSVKGLDIGTGASAIYPILAVQTNNWHMIGSDVSETSVSFAKMNLALTKGLSEKISIRHQPHNANIFKGIILPEEHVTFTMCNPPFFKSEEDAKKQQLRKMKNLYNAKNAQLNFGGQPQELWCNGGEALFIKRMIKESILFKHRVTWFTTLVSRSENLPKLEKQLNKLKAKVRIIPMTQGHKKSRILAWQF